MTVKVSLTVNGKPATAEVEERTLLVNLIRENLRLTGTHVGCDTAQCGACTVHIDGIATRSCQVPLEAVAGANITTIEGLAVNSDHVLQKLWVEMNVPQCGYCQTGVLMAAAALLKQVPKPTDQEIDLHVSNICRCGTYPRIRAAIHKAAEMMSA